MFSGLSAAQPSGRRWTALVSFTLQSACVAAAALFPMLHPQNLPPIFLDRRIFVPISKGEVRADTNSAGAGPTGAVPLRSIVVSSDSSKTRALEPMPPADDQPPGLDRMIGTGDPKSTITRLLSRGPGSLILPSVRPSISPRSVVMEGNLIHRIEPQYPVIAKQIRLEGAVVLKAIISREGNIERMEVVSGPILLARSATEAVAQWKYRPYLLNGEPVEVETQITVNFVLEH